MPDAPRRTLVSVTPMAIERDSRTLKQAASLASLGYRSIVVEGEASGIDRQELPFELVTVRGALPAWGHGAEPEGDAPGETGASAPDRVPGVLRRAVSRVALALHTLRWHLGWNLRAYRSLPPAQLYLVHHYLLFPAVALACVRHRGARWVYDAHDAYFELEPDDPNGRRPRHRAWERIERTAVRRAAGFSTVGEGIADVLEERHRRRPVAIRNCHDDRLDEPVARGLRETIDAGDDDFVLVSVGNEKPGMTVDEAIRALTLLPDRVRLVSIGRGQEAHLPRVRELGLEGRVHLLGPVPPTQVVGFIASADAALILYYPFTRNFANALPNRFFQSVAAGLPVLYPEALTEVAAIAERHQIGVPMDSREPGSIASAVRGLLDDPDAVERLRANAERAREQESWEHEEGSLARLVGSSLDGRAG